MALKGGVGEAGGPGIATGGRHTTPQLDLVLFSIPLLSFSELPLGDREFWGGDKSLNCLLLFLLFAAPRPHSETHSICTLSRLNMPSWFHLFALEMRKVS